MKLKNTVKYPEGLHSLGFFSGGYDHVTRTHQYSMSRDDMCHFQAASLHYSLFGRE